MDVADIPLDNKPAVVNHKRTATGEPTELRIRFDGTNGADHLSGTSRMAGIVNYFLGDDPSRWRTDVPTYGGISYEELYPGITLNYDGAGGQLKGTYTVATGADPTRIRWHYEGAIQARVEALTGDLQIDLPANGRSGDTGRTLTEHAPVAWQMIDQQRVAVEARYALATDGGVGLALGRYDPDYPLILDPTLTFSTYLGGAGGDVGYDIAVDDDGNSYIIGTAGDIFVTKLSADGGTVLYTTHLGGNDDEQGQGIAVDSYGDAYVTGWTKSTNFPTVNPLQPSRGGASCYDWACADAFAAKISPNGNSLMYSTYLGGDSADLGFAIAIDRAGSAVISGITYSGNFPTAHPLQATKKLGSDTFISKLDPSGARFVFSTFLGGDGYDEEGNDIAQDQHGNVYIVGMTTSTDFPTVTPVQQYYRGNGDLFVSKLKSDGSALLFSTYLGGNENEYAEGIAVDPNGNVYVTGGTESPNFPILNALDRSFSGISDAFVTKLNADGRSIAYSTFLGGSASDFAFDIAVGADGSASVTGYTDSGDFPTASPIQATIGPNRWCSAFFCEVFVARISSRGNALLFGSFLGGEGNDIGYGIALESTGAIHLTGSTSSSDFPMANPIQGTFSGNDDAFVTRIDIPATTLVNTLLNDTTGQPIPHERGNVTVYTGSTVLVDAPFTTDASGVFTATFSGPISQSVRLEYTAISGYADQYYDRKTRLSQADNIVLRSGRNTLTSRLVPATTLVNTLLDDLTGLPIGGAPGVVSVYSGTALLDMVPITTDASGVFTATFSALVNQSAVIGYEVDGYLRQYYDRSLSLTQATPVLLLTGRNILTSRLLPATILDTTLVDDDTGLVIANTAGFVDVFSGTAMIERKSFTSDTQGRVRVAFGAPISQTVRLAYQATGYAYQYYDRQATLSQADPIQLRSGSNPLIVRLVPVTTIVNTLIDDVTGQPIRNMSGYITAYADGTGLEGHQFVTDASGVYTITFSSLVGRDVRLEYNNLNGYARQFYDRKPTLERADALSFHSGRNMLTTRLAPVSLLANTLLDDATGEPLRNTSGIVSVYQGQMLVEEHPFAADAHGVYTMTFTTLMTPSAILGYRSVPGHARQFHDRAPTRDLATPVALGPGRNTLTTRLLAAPQFVNTLLDDISGQPIGNSARSVAFYSGATYLESRQAITDASGVYTMTLTNVPLSDSVQLEYGATAGYPRQYYDRKPTLGQADPIFLHTDVTTLTTRLIPTTSLTNTLLDDATGLPVPNTAGYVEIYSGTTRLTAVQIRTDANGVARLNFSQPISQSVRLQYTINGYPRQFYDRKLESALADPVPLHSGPNALTTRLLASPVLSNTLVDDLTRQPLRNTFGMLSVYQGSTLVEQRNFTTDASGVYTLTLNSTPIGQEVRLAYKHIGGYPDQYYDRAFALEQAQPVVLSSGINLLSTRLRGGTALVNMLVDDATGQPIANTTVFVTIYGDPAYPSSARFTTDASGVYTWTLAIPANQSIRLGYIVDGYPVQYYDRQLSLGGSAPVMIQGDRVTLASRLVKTPVYAPPPVPTATALPTATTTSTPAVTPTTSATPIVKQSRTYLTMITSGR